MLQESVFRTMDLPPSDRFDAWVQRMGSTHAPMRLSTDHTADYRGHQRVIVLGEVTVWPATFDPLKFHRTAKLVRQSDPETYHLSLLLKGEGAAVWGRRQATYRINDFHTNSSSRSWEVATGSDPVTIVGVELPRALVPVPGHRVDRVLGGLISGREGTGALLAQILRQLISDTRPYRPSDAPRLGTVVADLVTAAFAHAVDDDRSLPPETRSRTLVLHVKSYVRRHLGDPDLTPDRIAAAHHISRSYLYRLFRDEGLGIAAYIRDQRLEHARRDLSDPDLRTEPIHAVAVRWGFPRAAEFTRAFRTAYGVPPSELRERALVSRERARIADGRAGSVDAVPTGCGPSANDTPPASAASW
ncbi:helix-turn-helix domain-containing protein [Streptomyces sp. NPDC049687]|uniref:helix-turn-helix domain-containing protein n=1 Tax=Streptomyces sp. NPDC049687 TaxID=3365596 RepID=UPI0037A578D6